MLSKSPRIAMPSGPVVRASAAMAFATASSAGAAATASWFESPRQISPSREIAAFARSMRSASASETTTPKSRTSWVAWRSVAVSMPRHGDRAFLAEELAGDRRALGRGDEVGDRLVDAADALVERQGQQLGGREPEPAERLGRGTGAGGRLAQPPGQVLGRLLDAGHRDAGELAGALEHLDRGDRGAERLRELRLRIDRREPGADHGDAAGGRRGDGGRGRDLHPRREGGEAGIRRLHLASEPAEAAVAGLADALELGADLAAADDGEPDADPLLSHGCLRSPR